MVSASKNEARQAQPAAHGAERAPSILLIVSLSVLGIAVAYFAALYWITY